MYFRRMSFSLRSGSAGLASCRLQEKLKKHPSPRSLCLCQKPSPDQQAGSGKSKPRTARGRSSSLSVTKSTRKSTTSLRTTKIKKKEGRGCLLQTGCQWYTRPWMQRGMLQSTPNPHDHQDTCARCRFLARKHLWRELGFVPVAWTVRATAADLADRTSQSPRWSVGYRTALLAPISFPGSGGTPRA